MMLDWSKITNEDLIVLIQNTANKMKIQETVVEKDYWVCFILDYLFHKSQWKKAFTFNGGTSLSKCFSLIKRFSEDVDLILDWRLLGYEKDEPWENRSKTKQDRFNKESNKKTEEFLTSVLIRQMEQDLENIISHPFQLSIDENDPQTILFYYPKVFSSSYLTEAIRIEIGSLAAWTPGETACIEPYIATEYPQIFEEKKIEVRAVSVDRTFWEKATILHHEANRPPELKMPSRYARHYYDLYCIAKSSYKAHAFEQLHLLEKVSMFKDKFYPRKWAKYDDATKFKIKLVPDPYRYKELKEDYEQMKEMFMGVAPEFEEIMNTIQSLEQEIHNI
jgi:hypothetical protein